MPLVAKGTVRVEHLQPGMWAEVFPGSEVWREVEGSPRIDAETGEVQVSFVPYSRNVPHRPWLALFQRGTEVRISAEEFD